MNNGIDNYLNIIGSENSEIEMTNTGQRAVIADNSSTARSTKTTPTANAIHLHANASSYAIVQTKAHHSFTGGQIEVNGIDKTIITNEKDGGTAVSAQASGKEKVSLKLIKRPLASLKSQVLSLPATVRPILILPGTHPSLKAT